MHGTNIYIRYTICSVTDKNEELFDRTTVCGMLLNAVTHPIDIAINEKSVDGTARELEKEREKYAHKYGWRMRHDVQSNWIIYTTHSNRIPIELNVIYI